MAGATTSPAAVVGSFSNDGVVEKSEAPPAKMADVESARMKLRQRWELASVLNFLHVISLSLSLPFLTHLCSVIDHFIFFYSLQIRDYFSP